MNQDDVSSSAENTEAVSGSSQYLQGISATRLQYQVQHGIFKWSIENFSSFPAVKDKYILSPIFEMSKTWWHITLHPKSEICGQDKISLSLIRHKSDLGPDTVIVSYRLGLENGENKIWFKPDESIIFRKGYCYGFQTSVLGHLQDFLVVNDDDDSNNDNNIILSVLCEMYVKYTFKVSIASPRSRKLVIDSELSSDIVNLLKTEINYDVLIEIPKLRSRAHKSVLCARSKTLARMLEDDKSFIQLSYTRSCLNCVLLYMYSGNINYVAKNAVFSIGLYELACELSLFKLRELLTPYKIELKSRISIEECKIACTLYELQITDFLLQDIKSRVHFDTTTGIGIKICIQQMEKLEYLEFRIKVSGILAALDFIFELYILNKIHEPFKVIPTKILQDTEATFKNLIFTYTVRVSVFDIINCCETDGNLYLSFACKRYSLIHLSNMFGNSKKYQPVLFNDPISWLEELSLDLKEILESGYLSDITLSAFGKTFKAHRSVLAARSMYFRALFRYDQRKNEVIAIHHVEPRTLELILAFIYTGSINDRSDLDKIDFLEFYEAAEEFVIQSLKSICINYLSLNLDQGFVFEVLSSAERYGNLLLISECKNYINKHQVVKAIDSEESEGSE